MVAYVTEPRAPDHWYRYPQPWPLMSPTIDWQFDCRERRPLNLPPASLKAVTQQLTDAITSGGHWDVHHLQRELAEKLSISTTGALHLLRRIPGGASPQVGVWCGQHAVAGWAAWKERVYDTLSADTLWSFDDAIDALALEHASSVHAALHALARDGRLVILREPSDPEPMFARSRGANASYVDLHEARGRMPQPAA